MPCYSPLQAWRGKKLPSGKRAIVFKRSERCDSLVDSELKLPCGQCIGCRLERSRQWAIRCVHEASLYERNCFVTLTFDDDHLPQGGSLDVRDLQLFMKRLRKLAGGVKIRFFACGEYGENFGRPHYHAILFNWDFDDKYLWSVRDDVRLYRSGSLEKLWPFGFSTVGDVTFESAAYVARYVLKKVTGKDAEAHYVDYSSGELGTIVPEFVTMSRGGRGKSGNLGGIGRGFFLKWGVDIYPHDFVIMRGMRMKPPKFYDGLYELSDPVAFGELKSRRNSKAFGLRKDNDLIRLGVKEVVKKAQVGLLSRKLEDEKCY